VLSRLCPLDSACKVQKTNLRATLFFATRQLHDIVTTAAWSRSQRGEIHVLSLRGLMSWITLMAVLVGWSLVGLAVAYLFGRFIHGVESSGRASDPPLPAVTYLRHERRAARTSSRSTGQTRTRREATGGRRSH
jgi:hypothetical protein